MRPTWASVDLAAIEHNVEEVSRAVAPAGVLGVVKADAYGHGAVPVARAMDRAGIAGFCVSLVEEGIELRQAGIRKPIVVLGGVYGRLGSSEPSGAHRGVIEHELSPVVFDLAQVRAFAAAGGSLGRSPVDVHLKVDTGMGRLGVRVSELDPFLDALDQLGGVRVAGLMTHLASADCEDDRQSAGQLAVFDDVLARVLSRGHEPDVVHAANSAAALRYPDARFDLVRAGLALYGIAPVGAPRATTAGLRPAMGLRTEVAALRTIAEGEPVGYAATFVARRRTRVATIPLGYADGCSRSLGNRGVALVAGALVPFCGNVSMDMAALDVTDVSHVAVGDEVVLLGAQQGPAGSGRIRAEDVAARWGTIPYEVLTSVSRRVPRVYLRSET
ncbi:MAG: alanine racemase [Deltaproteobacteria bacterium]|nr:alanine racemase [Deltaproteobacteria bacterium]